MKIKYINKLGTNCNMSNYKIVGLSDLDKVKLYGDKLETLNWQEISIAQLIYNESSEKQIEEINSVYASVEIKDVKLIETPISIKSYKVALLDSNSKPVRDSSGNVLQCQCSFGFNKDVSTAFEIMANLEGNCLSGRELLISGIINEKIIYTSNKLCQEICSLDNSCNFDSYIIIYPKFDEASYLIKDIVVIDPNNPTQTRHIDGYLYGGGEIYPNLVEEFQMEAYIEDIFVKLIDNETIFNTITLFLSARPSCIL